MLCQGSRVDAVETGDFLIFEPLAEAAVSQPVTVMESIVLGNDCAAVYARTFEIIFEGIVAGCRRNAIVA